MATLLLYSKFEDAGSNGSSETCNRNICPRERTNGQRKGHLRNVSLVMRKPAFCICENKDADCESAKLISAFVFASRIVQSLYFLNTKFQAFINPPWLYCPVCVGPGRKPQRPVFSQRGSNVADALIQFLQSLLPNLVILSQAFSEKSWTETKVYKQTNKPTHKHCYRNGRNYIHSIYLIYRDTITVGFERVEISTGTNF